MSPLKRILMLFILSSSCVFAQPPGYSFGKKFEVLASEVSGSNDLINFPLYIQITDPELRSVSNGGHIENINGYDITFTTPDCITQLPFQIEDYNPVTGNLIVWVQISALSPINNTAFFMYYGNSGITTNPSSSSTWEAQYDGVWHMNNDPSSASLIDNSGNGVDGTSFGSMTSTDLVSGKLGNGIDFDGTNDYFALANKSFTNSSEISEISVSAWVNTTFSNGSAFGNWSIIDFDRSEYFNLFIHGNGQLGFSTKSATGAISDSYAGSAGDLNDGNWHHVVGVYNGTDKLLYIDGALALTVNNPHGGGALGTGTDRFGFIGEGSEASTFNGNRNNIYYDGQYDEIRLLNSALNADWISTEYTNQNNPSTFYSITEEYSASDLCLLLPIELGEFNAHLENDQVNLEWNTLSESNNDYFEVQKSDNTFDWEVIDWVQGAGNSIEEIHYRSIDFEPGRQTNYYRLKQVDYNGDFTFSEIRVVASQEQKEFIVYPNPAEDILFVEGQQSELINLQIFNSLGRDVSNRVGFVQISSNKIQLDLSNISDGMYLLSTGSSTAKIVKR